MLSSYVIPRTVSSPSSNANSSFLLLNNEFHNQTILSGFQFFAALNGSINIMVSCCAVFILFILYLD